MPNIVLRKRNLGKSHFEGGRIAPALANLQLSVKASERFAIVVLLGSQLNLS